MSTGYRVFSALWLGCGVRKRLVSGIMKIHLSRDFFTGIGWQDRQHRELIRRVNTFLSAVDNGEGDQELKRLFYFLDDYVVIHFDAEEQAMGEFDHPETTAHVQEHTRFIEDLERLKEEFERSSSCREVARRAGEYLTRWLTDHIKGTDKRLGMFLKERI